jgi:hypothetical protein
MAQVTVLLIPEEPALPDPRGGLKGEQTFWVHTTGMDKLGRPEMEMRNVPGMFVAAAGGFINHWAYHSIVREEIQAGENLMDESGPFPVVLQAREATDPWYEERDLKCLGLFPEGIVFQCDHDHDECGHPEEGAEPKVLH